MDNCPFDRSLSDDVLATSLSSIWLACFYLQY